MDPQTLRTSRLLLRDWRDEDVPAFAALNADPQVMEFFPRVLDRTESDAMAARIRKGLALSGYGLWAVKVCGITPFIGFVGLSVPQFEAHFTPCVEVGWRLARQYWGNGYATEAARAVLEFGFRQLELAEIVSFTVPANQRSRSVMERIGMTYSPDDDFENPRIPRATQTSCALSYQESSRHMIEAVSASLTRRGTDMSSQMTSTSDRHTSQIREFLEAQRHMDENLGESSLLRPVNRCRRSGTIGWMLMVGLAFFVFELTADSALAVVVGCLKFGTPDLKVAHWLRRADPDRVRGCVCSWFYVVMAIAHIGFMALLVMIVLFAVAGPGVPQGQIERQLIGELLVIFACFAGAALASWVAVASALRVDVHPWMDTTTRAAVRNGLWPPLLAEHSRRTNVGPGLMVLYAVITACIAAFTTLLITVGILFG